MGSLQRAWLWHLAVDWETGVQFRSGQIIYPRIRLKIIIKHGGITTIRMDGCADHMNKKPDIIIRNDKIITSEKYHSQNSSGDCKTQ